MIDRTRPEFTIWLTCVILMAAILAFCAVAKLTAMDPVTRDGLIAEVIGL